MKEFVPYNPSYEIVFGFLYIWSGIIEFGHSLQSISHCSINKVVFWVGEIWSHDTISVLGITGLILVFVAIVYGLFIFKADGSTVHRPEWREAGTSKNNIPEDPIVVDLVYTKLALGTTISGPDGLYINTSNRKLLVYDDKHRSGQYLLGLHHNPTHSTPTKMVILHNTATIGFILDETIVNYSSNTHSFRTKAGWWARMMAADIEVRSLGHPIGPINSRVTITENNV